jgi:DNA repair protein RadC
MVYSQKSSTKKTKMPLEDFEIKKIKDGKMGHRARVRDKFNRQDISKFTNIDLIEALLFFCNPRRDVRPEAKTLDKISCGSMLKFLFLKEEDIKSNDIKYICDNLIFLNKIILEISARFFKDKIEEFTFKNTDQVKDYLIARAGFLSKEELRVLFLNSKNKLIDDDVVSKGTINEIALYVREVVVLALKKTAVSIIISHNHPSGDALPSKNDIKATYDLKQALGSVSIVLQDHIITSGNNYFSFKQEGLL